LQQQATLQITEIFTTVHFTNLQARAVRRALFMLVVERLLVVEQM